jgi:hypothetical protein
VPRLRDRAADSGSFTGKQKREEARFGGLRRKNAKKYDRLSVIVRRGAAPDGETGRNPFTTRFASPHGSKTRYWVVNRTGLRRKCRFTQPRDFGQMRSLGRCARRVGARAECRICVIYHRDRAVVPG